MSSPASDTVAAEDSLERLQQVVLQAAKLLPAQGPISAFAFLNPLEALEEMPFERGLLHGARLFGCQPFLPKIRYWEYLTHGRITLADLRQVLREDLGGYADEQVAQLASRREIRMAMLEHPLHTGAPEELRWFVAQTSALLRLRPEASAGVREQLVNEARQLLMRSSSGEGAAHQLLAGILPENASRYESWTDTQWEEATLQALWRVCHDGVARAAPAPVISSHLFLIRHRDLLVRVTGDDSDALAGEVLIRFCAAFADQGFSDWKLPAREAGFWRAFCELYRAGSGPPDRWRAGLPAEIARIEREQLSPAEVIRESLQALGVPPQEWDEYIPAALLAWRGWAGMLWQMESRRDRVALGAPAGTLLEFLAVQLLLERLALAWVAGAELGETDLRRLRQRLLGQLSDETPTRDLQNALSVFQLAQILGWSPRTLLELPAPAWTQLVAEIEDFSPLDRRRIFHLAFERRLRTQLLTAVSKAAERPVRRVAQPRFQAVFCIDAREESFRRHLEEFAPDVETFSAPGFYCVPMYYRGVADAHFQALCPVVVIPKHWVVEEVVYTLESSNRMRARTRRALGQASRQMHRGSRGLAGAALLTAGFGVLASAPLVARVLFPQLTAKLSRLFGSLVAPPPVTRLRLERSVDPPGPEGDQLGFSVEEMANIAERVIRDIGLTSNFARVIFLFGHGSSAMNNPHKSAYDCGACSGSAGGPNARALALMLNDPRVRSLLAARGLTIPANTIFIGGQHNTARDDFSFFDLDLLPAARRTDFEAALEILAEVGKRNSQERCRRFYSVPLDVTPAEAKLLSEERTEDLAQTRPEYGNASNCLCFVGRRERVRGLFLDRRSFMHSYDPLQDDADHSILARILAPVTPVCSGINLTYFFSAIDPVGWGAGTKLPHNVASLLGVMDGYLSDLRSGLPQQGAEIHEPVRLLFVVETTPQAMLSIMDRNPIIGRILKNGWSQLAVLDPHSARIQVYRDGAFEPFDPPPDPVPHAATSYDWFRGWREHLAFATVGES